MDAGKIRISLDLNAEDLASEITRAVQRELEPVLKKIQAEINKTARDLDKIDGRSFVDVAVDAKLAEREISKQADAAAKAAVANEADAKSLRDLAKAEAEFAAAQKSGDLVKRTAAMQNLIRAQGEYEKATGKSATAEDRVASAAEGSARRRVSAEKSVQSEVARTARATEDAQRRAERAAEDAARRAARRAEQEETDAARRAARIAQRATEDAQRYAAREAEDARRRAARDAEDARAEAARTARLAAREAERAARDAARATAPGAGGGGGPRGPAPGPRPSFGTGQYGGRNFVTRFAMNPIGANTIGLALGGIPAATAGIVSLAGAINDLVMAGGAVPGIMAGIGASAATAAVGLSGMKDATNALIKAQKDDDPKEMAKAADQLKDMAPAAQETATAIANLVNGPFKDLRKSVQSTMFAGVANDIDRIGVAVGPRLRTDMGKSAAAWNSTIHTITGQLTNTTNLGFMDRIFGNSADAQNRANRAIAPMTNAIGALTAQSSNFLPRLADGVTKVSTRFDNFVNKSINNGNFDKWVDQGLRGMDHLGNSAINFGKALEGVFKASGGSGFLQWLETASGRLDRFVNSTKGQNQIADFFKEARQDAALWMPVLKDLGRLLGQMIEGAQQWSHILLPFLNDTLGVLTHIPGAVQGVTTAFLAWRTLSGVTDLMNKLRGVDSSLGGIRGKSGVAKAACEASCNCTGMGGGAGGAGGGTEDEERARRSGRLGRFGRAAGGLGASLGGIIGFDQLLEGINPDNPSNTGVGGWLQAVGGGAGTGALIGSMIEPGLGTLIGGGVGAAGGALGKLLFGDHPPVAPGGLLPGALAPDEYRKLIMQISQPGVGGQAAWNQQTIDQAVYGTSGSFDPRRFEFNTLQKGSTGYNDMANRLLQAGIPGVDQSNVGKTLDTIISQAQVAKGALDQLNNDIIDLPTGEVVLKDPTPEILQRVKDLGLGIRTLPNGLIALDTTQLNAANTKADELHDKIMAIVTGQGEIGDKFKPNPTAGGDALSPGFFMPGGRARGGVLPGWSPGKDNLLVPMSGGEGVLIPQAVRGIGGPGAIDSINNQFRHGYATGGVVGMMPWYPNSDILGGGPGANQRNTTMLLSEIKNLLSGSAPGPLSRMQMVMQSIATGGVPAGMLPKGTTPGRIGPFGTPIAPHNRQYDMMAGALRGLGGDPDYVFGPDPVKYAQTQWGDIQSKLKELAGQGGLGALGRSANPQDYIGPLSQFAQTGQITPDMARMGLDANNPVVTAILNARNSKGYEQVPGYISQVLGQGAFTGQLTPENQAIISALSTFQTTLAKQSQVDQELEMLLAPLGGMKGLQSQILANPALAAGLPSALLPGGGAGGAAMPAAGGAPGGGAVPIIQRPDGTWTSTNPEWAKLMQRESNGNPTIQNNRDSNAAAGHPSQGLFQITQPTWMANGGLAFARTPADATPEQQAQVAANILRNNPSGSDWGAGGPGRENAAALLAGLGAAPAPASPGLAPVTPPAGPAMPAPPAPTAGASQPDPSKPGYNGPPIAGVTSPAPVAPGAAPAGAIWMPNLGGYMFQGQLHKEWAPPGGAVAGAPNLGLPQPAAPPPPAPSPFGLPPIPGAPPPGAPGMPPVPGAPSTVRPGAPDSNWWGRQLGAAGTPLQLGGQLPDVRGAHPQEAYALQAIQQMFPWATLNAGDFDHPKDQGWHGKGQAIDIGGGTAEQQAQLSNWLTQFAPFIEELIHQGPGVSQNIKSGKLGPAIDMPGSVYNTGQAGYHGDHVHLAITDPQAQAFITALGGPTLPPGALAAGGGLGPGGMPISGAGFNGLSALGGTGMAGIIPVYVVNMPGAGGGGGMGNVLQNLFGGPIAAAGGAATNVAGDAISAGAADIPGAALSSATMAAPAANALTLAKQGNPLAVTAALGYNVPDLSRSGAVQLAGATFAAPQQQYLSDGRMLSNTTGLYQRTMTDLGAQLNAMREQMVGATKDVSKGLGDKVLTPIMKAGVNSGISTLSNTVLTSMGTQLGDAMAPAIGEAVAKNAPSSSGSDAAGLAGVPFAGANAITSTIGLAGGGGVTGGTAGHDSVPAMLMPNEWVMTTDEVAKMGGFGGMQRFTAALGRSAGVKHFAAGGGVIGNKTVGGDFFGVSQVPIIGAIVNMLVNILLTMIGAQITVRDTLTTLTDSFRQFRGDTFKAFDAQGRMFNDNSGLNERSLSSEQTVTDERVRILTQVLQALIKYIIDKVIVPIAEAVGQALINAGASAAGGALGPFGGGAITGGVSTIGDAAVQVAGQVGQDFGDAASATIISALFQGGTELFPGLATGIFSGAGLENSLTGPLGALLGGVVGGFTGLLTALMSIVGLGTFGSNTGTLLGFDEGGVASGVGMMPKATIHPERVLSPSQTDSFERLVAALEGGNFGGGNSTVIHAPFTVTGGIQGATEARDRLLELMT